MSSYPGSVLCKADQSSISQQASVEEAGMIWRARTEVNIFCNRDQSISDACAALHFAQLFGDEGSDLVSFFAAVSERLIQAEIR